MKTKTSRAITSYYVVVLLSLIFSGILCLYTLYNGYTTPVNKVVAVATILQSLYLCYLYRYNIGLFFVMIMIAYTNYSVAVGVYLYPEVRPNALYAQFTRAKTYGPAIICVFIFCFALILLSKKIADDPKSIDSKSKQTQLNFEYNDVIAYGAVVIYLGIFFLTYSFGSDTERGSGSALTEYRILVMIVGSYYCGKKNNFKWIWTVVVLLTSILTFYAGNRVSAFPSCICLIVMFYSDFIDYKKVVAVLPFAVVFLALVGFMRGGFSLSIDGLVSAGQKLMEDKLTYEGAIFGYLPSLSTVELADVIPTGDKLKVLLEHIGYVFNIGTTSNNPDLSFYTRQYYVHYWGFVSPVYFYFWLGYLGPVIFALLVNLYKKLYIKLALKEKPDYLNKLKYILSIFFVSNVSRWYCYGPMGLIRGMFVCFVVFTIVYVCDRLIRKKVVF